MCQDRPPETVVENSELQQIQTLLKNKGLTLVNGYKQEYLDDLKYFLSKFDRDGNAKYLLVGEEQKEELNSRCVEWICQNPEVIAALCFREIRIENAIFSQELDLDHISLKVPLTFYNCQFKNTLQLRHAKLRYLCLDKSTFLKGVGADEKVAIDADGICVEGPVYLRHKFEAHGKIKLLGAKINDVLYCGETGEQTDVYPSQFINPENKVLELDRANIDKGVFIQGATVKGKISLLGTTVGKVLVCKRSQFFFIRAERFGFPGNICLFILGHPIGLGRFKLDPVVLDLKGANIEGNVHFEGTKFCGKLSMKGTSVDGVVDDGVTIYRKFWNFLLWFLIDFGNKPWLSLVYSAILIILGSCIIFAPAQVKGLIQPPEKSKELYETGALKFDSIVYSADVFIPVINFHQEDFWQIALPSNFNSPFKNSEPNIPTNFKELSGYFLEGNTDPIKFQIERDTFANTNYNFVSDDLSPRYEPYQPSVLRFKIMQYYFWFHIGAGWVLTTISVAGFTGAIKSRGA